MVIYFDNAATTWPKPEPVFQAMEHCMRYAGANPGRGGHKMAIEAARILHRVRENLAKLFNISNPLQIVLTSNATEALNLGIKGLLQPGDHVITTSMEHNAVARPLHLLSSRGVEVTKVQADTTGYVTAQDIEKAIKSNTKAVVMTHASNVVGTLMPIAEVGRMTAARGIKLVVDAAQSAGIYDIDVQAMNIDLLAFPGHKGLLGPQGTGGLYIAPGIELQPLKEGGTGSNSETLEQPDIIPDRFESGTPNTVGFAGLNAGLEYLFEVGIENIRAHEEKLTAAFLAGLAQIPGVEIYGPNDAQRQAAVVAFNLSQSDSSEVGFVLDRVFDIACRSGLHCAPEAHRTMGTCEKGVVRFSFAYSNTLDEIEQGLEALRKVAAELA